MNTILTINILKYTNKLNQDSSEDQFPSPVNDYLEGAFIANDRTKYSS